MNSTIRPARLSNNGSGSSAVRMAKRAHNAAVLQRKCECGAAAGIGDSCADCERTQMQRKAVGVASGNFAPQIVNEVLASSGHALDARTRAYTEPRFSHSFGEVRVHTDARAAASAAAVGAAAYTVQNHIVFGANRYAPSTDQGARLLAHELTHVRQQSGQSPRALESPIEMGSSHDEHEREADVRAQRIGAVARDSGGAALSLDHPRIQRFALFDFVGDVFSHGPGEALSRLFGEGDFTEAELVEYLDGLTRSGKAQDRYDSDNKARAVVKLWSSGNRAIRLTPDLKKLLVREMWQGQTSSADAQGILTILERSFDEDLKVIFSGGGVRPKQLFDDFGKEEQRRLQQIFDRRFKGGSKAVMNDVIEPAGSVIDAPYLNDRTLHVKWEAGLNSALALLEKKTTAGQCAFPRPKEVKIDEDNWRPAQSNKDLIHGDRAFGPKSAAPFEAVGLLFDNLDKWTCDCRLFPEIAMLYAWREALKDSPDAFNKKFAGLRLTPESTTGLERDVVQSDDDAAWKNAPVGTKVVWENTSPARKEPWTHEHAIKTYQGKPGEPDRYAAHPLGYNLTEAEVKEGLARAASDYPWTYEITATSLTQMAADGVDAAVIQDLGKFQGQKCIGMRAFLEIEPLKRLREQAVADAKQKKGNALSFQGLINTILSHTRGPADPKAGQDYVNTNIVRFKLEIPK